jgi:hypothetical protein
MKLGVGGYIWCLNMDIVGIMWEIVYMDGMGNNVYDGKYCVVIECRWNGDWWI